MQNPYGNKQALDCWRYEYGSAKQKGSCERQGISLSRTHRIRRTQEQIMYVQVRHHHSNESRIHGLRKGKVHKSVRWWSEKLLNVSIKTMNPVDGILKHGPTRISQRARNISRRYKAWTTASETQPYRDSQTASMLTRKDSGLSFLRSWLTIKWLCYWLRMSSTFQMPDAIFSHLVCHWTKVFRWRGGMMRDFLASWKMDRRLFGRHKKTTCRHFS